MYFAQIFFAQEEDAEACTAAEWIPARNCIWLMGKCFPFLKCILYFQFLYKSRDCLLNIFLWESVSSSIEFLCKDVCFWKWREFCSETRVDFIFKGLSLGASLLVGKSILVARHLQMWNVKSSSKCIFICFDAENCSIYKLGEIHLLTYCIVQNACWCILLWKVTNWVGNKSWPSLILFQSLIRILWYSFCPRENLSPSPGSWTQ